MEENNGQRNNKDRRLGSLDEIAKIAKIPRGCIEDGIPTFSIQHEHSQNKYCSKRFKECPYASQIVIGVLFPGKRGVEYLPICTYGIEMLTQNEIAQLHREFDGIETEH